MAADPKLVVALEAQLTRFEKALKDAGVIADRKASEIETRFNRVNPQFSGLTAGLNKGLAGVAAAVSVGSLKAAFDKAIQGLSQVNDLAERSGVSTDFIQSLGFAVEQAGGSMEDAARSASKFGKQLGSNTEEGNALQKMLEANGVSIREASGQLISGEKAFAEWARLISNIQDPLVRMNQVMTILGDKVGPKMLTTIMEIGQKGLPAFIQGMKEAGVVAEESIVKKGDEIGDAWNALTTAMFKDFQHFVVKSVEEFEKIKGIVAYLKNLITTGSGATPGTVGALQAEAESIRKQLANASQQEAGGLLSPAGVERIQTLRDNLSDIERQIASINRLTGKPGEGNIPAAVTGTIIPPPKDDKSSASTKVRLDDFDREIQKMREKLLVEEKELETINLSVEARERAKIAIMLENAARRANMEAGKANTDITEEQRLKIEALAEEYGKLAAKVAAANAPLATFAREARDINKNLQEAGVNALRGLEDAMIGIATGAKTTKEAIKDMVDAILADLMRLAIRMAITGPLAGMLGNMMMPVGPGAPLSLAPPIGRAVGGSVSSGVAYRVGEDGPELFVPGRSGTIVPNQAMSRSGSGFNLQIINNGAKVDVSEPKRGSDGNTSLVVMIDRLTAKNGSTPGTSTNKMLRFQGAKIPLTRRA